MNIVEIEGDYFRADRIEAIELELLVHLIGRDGPFAWDFDSVDGATRAKLKAVKAWINALPR